MHLSKGIAEHSRYFYWNTPYNWTMKNAAMNLKWVLIGCDILPIPADFLAEVI